jgi:hypothetical protein
VIFITGSEVNFKLMTMLGIARYHDQSYTPVHVQERRELEKRKYMERSRGESCLLSGK